MKLRRVEGASSAFDSADVRKFAENIEIKENAWLSFSDIIRMFGIFFVMFASVMGGIALFFTPEEVARPIFATSALGLCFCLIDAMIPRQERKFWTSKLIAPNIKIPDFVKRTIHELGIEEREFYIMNLNNHCFLVYAREDLYFEYWTNPDQKERVY